MDDYTFRKSYLTMIIGALFFGACGVVLFMMDLEAGDGGRRAAFIASIPYGKEILLLCCAGFVGICVLALVSGRPRLTAGSQGLIFTGMFGKVVRLQWSDIQGIDVAPQYLTLHHQSNGKRVKTNIGGMFKMKPEAMVAKLNELSAGRLFGTADRSDY